MIENQALICQLKTKISKHTELIQAWDMSSVALTEMQNSQKSVDDKTGLGFNNHVENSASDTQPRLNENKGKYITFVKSTMVNEHSEPSKPTVQSTESKNKGKRYGIEYSSESSTDTRNWSPKRFSYKN